MHTVFIFCISNTVWTSVLALNSENYLLEAFNFLVAWWGHNKFMTTFWTGGVRFFESYVIRGEVGGQFYAKMM